METSEKTSQEIPGTKAQEIPQPVPAASKSSRPVRVESDLNFVRTLNAQGADTLRQCFQCGTCSATCDLSPDSEPFPRKEMAWAVWGMKEQLVTDPDVWLCYQCGDCSARCPRGARPGDVLNAVRRESIRYYAFPRFMSRFVDRARYIPVLLGVPVVFLGVALLLKEPVENVLKDSPTFGEHIVYSYSSIFPHWLLNSFFLFFSLLVVLSIVVGVRRFWRGMKARAVRDGIFNPVKSVRASILSVLKTIFTHEKFARCTTAHARFLTHFCVFFGFLALSVVTLWVITSGINPLIRSDFIYPFNFLSPWKILANLGGLSLLFGTVVMIRDRVEEGKPMGAGSYFDWAFLLALLLIVVTGFLTEVLHYLRLEPHRHVVYFVHLVFVFVLMINLPFSKFAHAVYRATALVFAEHIGRDELEKTKK